MPENLVEGQDADDVASYVASVAGVGNPNAAAPAPHAPLRPPRPRRPRLHRCAGDVAAGKEVFTTAGCASCHTLADAGTNGTVGPNLDEAKPSAALVKQRVTNGRA